MSLKLIEGNAEIRRRYSRAKLRTVEGNCDLEQGLMTRLEVEFFFYPPGNDFRKLCDQGFDRGPNPQLATEYLRKELSGLETAVTFLDSLHVHTVETNNRNLMRALRMNNAVLMAKATLCTHLVRSGKDVGRLFKTYETMCLRLDSHLHVRLWDCAYELILHADAKEKFPRSVYVMCDRISYGANRGKIFVKHDLTPYREVFFPKGLMARLPT